MPSRERVLTLLREGMAYDEVSKRLGITPGLAYLIATGLPADGSDSPSAHAHDRPAFLKTSQQLSNPQPVENPTTKESVLTWIRGRASSDDQMHTAAVHRTASPAPRQGDERGDAIDVLTRDHNRVTNLLQQLAAIPGAKKGGSPARMSARKSIVDMITVDLAGHVTAEQRHFWPTVSRAFDDGKALADKALEMSGHGNDILTALGKLDGTEEEFDELVEQLSASSRKHVAFQEPIFLRLREELASDDLDRLADDLVGARDHGPTRPHPHAPEKPPGVGLAAVAGGLLDRARDALGERPADREGKPAQDAADETEDPVPSSEPGPQTTEEG